MGRSHNIMPIGARFLSQLRNFSTRNCPQTLEEGLVTDFLRKSAAPFAKVVSTKKGRRLATLYQFCCLISALSGFEPALRLVDDVDAAFTAHDAAIAMTLLERAEGIANFHVRLLHVAARRCADVAVCARKRGEPLVDDTGIEPVTPSMSTKCSTAELIVLALIWSRWSHKQIGRGRSASGPAAIKGVGCRIKGF